MAKKENAEKGIRIIEMNNLEDLKILDMSCEWFSESVATCKEKWTKYFINGDEMKLIQKLKDDRIDAFAKFSEYGLINVGITTGNNGYFSVTEEVTNHYHLEEATLPLIGRSSHAHGISMDPKLIGI